MVEYNKNKIYKKKDGRVLIASGPRDAQRRQQSATTRSAEELDILRDEINMLRTNLDGPRSTEDVATKIDEAIEEISAELEQRYIDRISTLESTLADKAQYIVKLEDRVEKQDELIQKLTNNIGTTPIQPGAVPATTTTEGAPARPDIDSVFIDPTVKGSEDKLESHVKIKEVESTKPTTSNNIDKLKNLMGSKLPK